MNKNLIIGIVVLIVLAGGGYFFIKLKKMPALNELKVVDNLSIKDALLSKTISLQCDYTDEAGKKTTSYIKTGAIRADFAEGSSIFKDQKVYFWQKNQKDGFMMDVPDPMAADAKASEGTKAIVELEKYKDQCKPAVISDSLFTPPADVKFTNFSDFQMPNIQIPSE